MSSLEKRHSTWVATLVPLLLGAAALRLAGVAWDGAIGAHPDERHLVGVAEGLSWPDRLSPFALDPGFAYGHLPVYLLALVGGQDRLMVARLLAGLLDTGTVGLAAALGRRLGGWRVGLLTAALLGVMPLHVQQAHYGTADPLLAFFVTGALLFAAWVAERGQWREVVLAGLSAGLSVGCKAGAVLVGLPLAAACVVGAGGRWQRAVRGLTMAGMALAAFAVTNPFALLDLPRFLTNVAGQAALAGGTVLVPYTFQYHGTLPYVYPVAQQLIWGMGPVLGLLCFGGLGAALWRAVRQPPSPAGWVALAWALPFFALTGGLFAKFPRYLLPLTPLLAIYGASAMGGSWRRGVTTAVHWARGGVGVLAVLTAGLASLGLVVSYQKPHPWVAASEWMEARFPRGSIVAVEAWDHPLPLHAAPYDLRVLPIFDEETERKWAVIEEGLADADVVIIASRRGYGALAAWPERFPQTTAYYRALLGGERGFRVVACFGRWPRVGPLAVADDPLRRVRLPTPELGCQPQPPVVWLPRLDESFVVYDHPLVVVLQRAADVAAASAQWYNPSVRER